jgi:hypothetical protein
MTLPASWRSARGFSTTTRLQQQHTSLNDECSSNSMAWCWAGRGWLPWVIGGSLHSASTVSCKIDRLPAKHTHSPADPDGVEGLYKVINMAVVPQEMLNMLMNSLACIMTDCLTAVT